MTTEPINRFTEFLLCMGPVHGGESLALNEAAFQGSALTSLPFVRGERQRKPDK